MKQGVPNILAAVQTHMKLGLHNGPKTTRKYKLTVRLTISLELKQFLTASNIDLISIVASV